MIAPALVLAALAVAVAPSPGAIPGKVTVRVVGIADGTGIFTATGAIDDAGGVSATGSPTRLHVATSGKKGVLTFLVSGKTWRIVSGTNVYRGLYGHGAVRRGQGGSTLTLTGTVERPRQPTL